MPNLSTKISEKITFDDDKLIIKKTHDASVALKDAAHAREVTDNSFGSDYKHVGNVDMAMLAKRGWGRMERYTSGQRCAKKEVNE
mgnify:CR=1 FL=1